MNAWVVLDPVTLAVVDTYASESSRKKDYSGYLNVCLHLPVPEGLDPTVIMAVRDSESGEITLQEDPQKVAAKTDATVVDVAQFPGAIKGTEAGYIPLMDYLVNSVAKALAGNK